MNNTQAEFYQSKIDLYEKDLAYFEAELKDYNARYLADDNRVGIFNAMQGTENKIAELKKDIAYYKSVLSTEKNKSTISLI